MKNVKDENTKEFKNEFKKHVETIGEPESPVVFATTFVHENMETAWIAVRSVFGDRATPDHAFAFFDRMHRVERDVMGSHHSHDDDDDEGGMDCGMCGCPEGAHTEGVGACSHTHCDCKKFVNPGASC